MHRAALLRTPVPAPAEQRLPPPRPFGPGPGPVRPVPHPPGGHDFGRIPVAAPGAPSPGLGPIQRSGRKGKAKIADDEPMTPEPATRPRRNVHPPVRFAPPAARKGTGARTRAREEPATPVRSPLPPALDDEKEFPPLSPSPAKPRASSSRAARMPAALDADDEASSREGSDSESDTEYFALGNPTRSGVPKPYGFTIRQPLRRVLPAEPPKEERKVTHDELQERLDLLKQDYARPKHARQVVLEDVAKSKGVPVRNMGMSISGWAAGGLGPTDESHKAHLPRFADHTRMRPMQALSHVSEVLYGAALHEGHAPVEVQAGRAETKGGKQADLFLSANDPTTQAWINDAMKDPLGLVHRMAALSNEEIEAKGPSGGRSLERARKSALKILFNPEQKKARLDAIAAASPGPKGRTRRRAVHRDLERVDDTFHRFLSGDVHVVHNPRKKHAEQNIAAAMYDSEVRYTKGEIAGTKIRCEGCSAEAGTNLTDEHGTGVSGKIYAAQASEPKHAQVLGNTKTGAHQIQMGDSSRLYSPSPLKAGTSVRSPVAYPKGASKGKGKGKGKDRQRSPSVSDDEEKHSSP